MKKETPFSYTRKWCIVAFMSLFLPLFVHAQQQIISIDIKDVPLEKAIQEIAKQSSLNVAYSKEFIDTDKKMSLTLKNTTVEKALTILLQDTNIRFRFLDGSILLYNRDFQGEVVENISRKITVKGQVLDEASEPLIGVTISIKGTTTGTVTDIDGNYTISAHENDVLLFSYLGYKTENIKVSGKTTIDLTMYTDSKQLETVVVTALGIKRATKALSYNVQEIKSEELTTVRDVNFMNSLAGKVAGVNINSSSTGMGGAARVIMRGPKSITKDNNALYVVDGVPMFNVSGGEIGGNYTYADQPNGDGMSDFNPDDIESISVLSGPAASALYGSSAANGVIIITTQKGKVGKPRVTISNQLTFSEPAIYYEFQNKYAAPENRFESWGPETQGMKNDRLDFFETGMVNQVSANLSVGTDRNQTYASISNSYSEGIIPKNKYNKTNLTLRNTTSFLNDKMTLDFGFSYINQTDENMVGQGQYFNPIPIVYTFPTGRSILDYKEFEKYDSVRGFAVQNWPKEYSATLDAENPYWLLNRMPKTNDRIRYMMNVNLKYQITDWLNIAGRVRFDNANTKQQEKFYATTKPIFSGNEKTGKYKKITDDNRQTYADVIATAYKTFGDFSINSFIGASLSDIKTEAEGFEGPLMVPNFFAKSNLDMKSKYTHPIQTGWHEQQQSIFASAELSYKNMLYLTLTGRHEWASQLVKTDETSFFYPSAGLSFLLSEALKMPEQISYLQLKGSYASVGSPIQRNLSIKTWLYDRDMGEYKRPDADIMTNIKAERTNSWEVGLSTKLFNDILGFNFTYYQSKTSNQLLTLDMPVTSMYTKKYVQAGDIENKGIELGLSSNIKLGNIKWNSNFTAGLNNNKILNLINEEKLTELGGLLQGVREAVGSAYYELKEGGTIGDLYIKNILKLDENGNGLFDATGKGPATSNETVYAGSVLPKWNLGFRNSFSWKDFSLGFLLSARLGGIVVSPTEAILDGYGVTKTTEKARDRGYVKIGQSIFDPEDYYKTVGSREGPLMEYVYKADNLRVQELSLGYRVPPKVFKNKLKLHLSLVASNLWIIYKDAPFDPELTASTGTFYQGIDFFMQPNTRNIGFSLKAEF